MKNIFKFVIAMLLCIGGAQAQERLVLVTEAPAPVVSVSYDTTTTTLASITGENTLYNAVLSFYGLPTDGSIGMAQFRALASKLTDSLSIVSYVNYATNGPRNISILNAPIKVVRKTITILYPEVDSVATAIDGTVNSSVSNDSIVSSTLNLDSAAYVAVSVDTTTTTSNPTASVVGNAWVAAVMPGDTIAFTMALNGGSTQYYIRRDAVWCLYEGDHSALERQVDAICPNGLTSADGVKGPKSKFFVGVLVDEGPTIKPSRTPKKGEGAGSVVKAIKIALAPACKIHPSKVQARPAKRPKKR